MTHVQITYPNKAADAVVEYESGVWITIGKRP